MEEQQKKQLDFLNETIAHYNSKNRCEINKRCKYSPIEGVSEGCAVGRHITDKELCKHLDDLSAKDNGSVNIKEVFDLLPKNLQELSQRFLGNIQQLHDNPYNWTETGLSIEGLNYVRHIKQIFSLNETF